MVYNVKEAITRIELIPELTDKLTYDFFTGEAPKLPFAAYTYDFTTGGADDYYGVQYVEFKLELYSEIRDIALETKILNTFADVEITSDSEYLQDERMYITTFNFIFPQKLVDIE